MAALDWVGLVGRLFPPHADRIRSALRRGRWVGGEPATADQKSPSSAPSSLFRLKQQRGPTPIRVAQKTSVRARKERRSRRDSCEPPLGSAAASAISEAVSMTGRGCRCGLRLRSSRLQQRRSSPPGLGSAPRSKCRTSPLGAGREAPLRFLRAVPRGSEPVRARHPDRPPADRGRPRPAQAHHRLRAHLFDRPWPRPDPGDRQAPRHQGDAGLWLSSLPDLTRKQIDSGIALAKRFPDVIQAVIVGNEVLLRGEMSAPRLAETIREVKAQVPMPVTYADVWEFWLRHRDVAAAVDFITIHILPYWEDFPIPARDAAHARRRHPQEGRRRLSGPGDLPRRVRMAERRAHARGRLAVARQPGARHPRRARARQARELPRQPDRGLRPALEAPARRHGRRPLGALRRLSARGQVRLGRRRLEPSRIGAGRRPPGSPWRALVCAAALAGRRRRAAAAGRRRCGCASPPWHSHPEA